MQALAEAADWGDSSGGRAGKWCKSKSILIMFETMRVSVLVPSYRRPKDLARCLAALVAQTLKPDRVIVVTRANDFETLEVAKSSDAKLPVELVEVSTPGQVHALNAGLARCPAGIVAITDDDAAPRPDWLRRIRSHFDADRKVGGVGGRDWVHEQGGVLDGEKHLVGRFLWFGRMVGNHHLGAGPAREVDFLKGANCSFRIAAIGPIGFDARLRGAGAQVHNDLTASLAVKRAGWKLIYDPMVAVDHFPSQRFDEDKRHQFDANAAANRNHNFRLAIASGLPPYRRLAVLFWLCLVGSKSDPGVLLISLMFLKRDHVGLSRHRSVRHLLAKKS